MKPWILSVVRGIQVTNMHIDMKVLVLDLPFVLPHHSPEFSTLPIRLLFLEGRLLT